MFDINILDLYYIVLLFFTIVIWILLILILLRVLKILWVIIEITNYYNILKEYISIYARIPEFIKNKILSFFSKK